MNFLKKFIKEHQVDSDWNESGKYFASSKIEGLVGGSKVSPGRLRVKIHDPIDTKGMVNKDRIKLCDDVRKLILNDLRNS